MIVNWKTLTQICLMVCLTFIILGCTAKKKENTSQQEKSAIKAESTSVADDTNGLGEMVQKTSIWVKDSADYSLRFLESLTTPDHQKVLLQDSFMILGAADTFSFPRIPELHQRTTLTAINDDLAIALHIERTNYSSVAYRMELTEFGKRSIEKKGTADLHSHFYFGAESDEYSGTGESYLSTEFSDKQDSCYTHIRLGRIASSTRLLGKIKCNCNGDINDIHLNNFVTLVEK